MNQTLPSLSRAAVFVGPGKPLVRRTFTIPTPDPGEAIIEIRWCTVCGSDLHTIQGKRIEPTPSILGHEILGVVAALGTPGARDIDGRPLRIGDRVTWSTCVSCHRCHRCLSGLPQKCAHLTKYGHQVAEGRYALSGGMAQHIVLRRDSSIIRLDPTLPDLVACPANCATATVAAALRVAGTVSGKRMLVFGAGMLGLTAAAMGKHFGAEHVTVCDLNRNRLLRATDFGADAIDHCPGTDSAADENDGYDVVIDCTGSPGAIEQALNAAAIGGRVVLVGSVMPSRTIAVDPQAVVRRCLSIHGIHNYAPHDLQTAIDFLQQCHDRYPFAQLVEQTFALDDVNEAIAESVHRAAIRVALRPSFPVSLEP